MTRATSKRKCHGFGEIGRWGTPMYKKCDRPPGKNPYWCDDCNKRRIEHISKRFGEIVGERVVDV